MNDEVLKEFKDTQAELLTVVSSFTHDQFNEVPFEGSWTAGQVTRHILLFSSSAGILRGPVKKTLRQPDEHVAKLKSMFLDFSTKMSSPKFIIPEKKDYTKDQLLSSLQKTGAEIKEIIKTTDLSETCLSTPPELGELTRLELIRFISFHTKRHINQLKNILSCITDIKTDAKTV